MSKIKDFLHIINDHKEYRRQVREIMELPAREAYFEKVEPSLPAQVKDYLSSQGIKLYSHQARCLKGARAGENIVLVTSTASGKTLAFNLPVMEALLEDPGATALYLYPMKALAYDQLKGIKEMEKGLRGDFKAAVYDGDTPRSQRGKIRQQSRIILSNPHAFHYYLSWHKLWQRFFRNLKYIVIDEGHWYRGIFGTNVAFFLRRLQRILHYYGADPQIIMASATMADPVEHAYKLTRKDFKLIQEDGSSKSKRTYLFWDAAKNPNLSPHLQTADLFARCVNLDMQTLCFTVSRKMAELTARWAGQAAEGISSYRAGYLPEDRRKLEKKLKEGELKGLASTNALELGVNIGGLDAVVIGGYPGTIASFHQRAGRAGRSGQEALILQLFYDNPLDGYILSHPNYLFREPVEQAVISLENEHILKRHLKCGAEELVLEEDERSWFGPGYQEGVRALVAEGDLKFHLGRGNKKRYYALGKGACFQVNLSSFDKDEYRLVCQESGELLEILNKRQAYMEAHPGAVFLHMTKPYRVNEFDEEKKVVKVKLLEEDYYTTVLSETSIKVEEILKEEQRGQVSLKYGRVMVTEKVWGYLLKKYDKVVKREEIDMEPLQFDTRAVWAELPLKGLKGDLAGGLHGAEHLLIGVTPLLAMCDRWDIGGVSMEEKSRGAIFIYDGFPGGIGISWRLFSHFHQLTERAVEIVEKCRCREGCPRCLMSPKCGNNNDPLDKRAALMILRNMMYSLKAFSPQGEDYKAL